MFYLAKSLDPTRLVEDNSAYLYDHVITDLNTWHFYIGDYDRARRHVAERRGAELRGRRRTTTSAASTRDVQGAEAYRQGTQPLLNSEYAGLSAWGGDRDISYSFKFLTSELRRHDMICGYVYTELTDVEWEHNGFLNYDRTPKEFGYDRFVPGMTVADLNGADFVGLDCPPCQTAAPGRALPRHALLLPLGRRAPSSGPPCAGASPPSTASASPPGWRRARPVEPRHYGVTVFRPVEATLPAETCLVTVALLVEDGGGRRAGPQLRQRGRLRDSPWRRLVESTTRTSRGYASRFVPGDFIGSSWLDPASGQGEPSSAARARAGWSTPCGLPDDLDYQGPRRLRLRFEAGARTAQHRLDWRDTRAHAAGRLPADGGAQAALGRGGVGQRGADRRGAPAGRPGGRPGRAQPPHSD